jgi:hypothetical protein
MNLGMVMDELAEQLKKIDGLRVYDYPPDAIQVPSAIVGWPADGEFDSNNNRGMDSMTIPVIVAVGKAYDRATKPLLGKYCDGSGPHSIKATLERPDALYLAFGKESLVVGWPDFDVITIAGFDYMAAVFPVQMKGKGE